MAISTRDSGLILQAIHFIYPGAADYGPFSGEGRFVYIDKLLKVHISSEANSLDLIPVLKETVCIMRFLNSVFFMNK